MTSRKPRSVVLHPLLGALVGTAALSGCAHAIVDEEEGWGTSVGLGGDGSVALAESADRQTTEGGGATTGSGSGGSGLVGTGGDVSGGSAASSGGAGGAGSSSSAGGTSAGGSAAGGSSASSGGTASGGASSSGGGGASSGGSGGAASGGGSSGSCATPSQTDQTKAKCGDTIVYGGALYSCVAQAAGVNGEGSGCGQAGVYCSTIAPDNAAWGATAWSKLADCE